MTTATAKRPKVTKAWRKLLCSLPGYDPFVQAEGCWFNAERAQYYIDFIETCCTHVEGDLAGQPFLLAPWQKAIMGNLFGWYMKDDAGRTVRRYRKVFIYVPRKNGKALALDTPLPTPAGWTTMGDVQAGDTLFDEFGEPCTVLEVHPVMHDHSCYRVTFSDGSSIVADAEHLWRTKTHRPENRIQTWTTEQIAATLMNGGTPNHTIEGGLNLNPIRPVRQVVSVEPVPSVPVRCIRVDSPSHLFLAGEGMVPTHNTPMCAAIANAVLFLDDEQGQQDYCAAADTEQAKLLFAQMKGMIEAEPEMDGRVTIYTTYKSIEKGDSRSTMKVLSGDAKAKQGKNSHFIAVDELHEQPNHLLVDALERSMASKNRKQPLLLYITTADYDRPSICNARYAYACKVRDGIIQDARFLPVIFEANIKPHTETLKSLDAIEKLDSICTCHNVRTTLIAQLWHEACARHAITAGGKAKTDPMTARGAETTQRDRYEPKDSALPVTNNNSLTQTQNTKSGQFADVPLGHSEIRYESRRPMIGGDSSLRASELLLSTGDMSHTDSPSSNTRECGTNKMAAAPSVGRKQTFASIIATIRSECEASSARSAILESASSEILRIYYEAHLPTCNARTAKLNGDRVVIEDPGDDWKSEKVWEKANPNLDISVSREYLRDACRAAQESPIDENTFKRYHLNIVTEQAVRCIPMDAWDACAAEPVAAPGQDVWGALDIGAIRDLCAFVALFRDDDEGEPITVEVEGTDGQKQQYTFVRHSYSLKSYFWLPEKPVTRNPRMDDQIKAWKKEKLIRTTPGDVVDYDTVAADITKILQPYSLQQLAIDQGFQGVGITQTLQKIYGERIVAFRQGILSMAAPCREMLELMQAKRLRHGGHPVLRWMASNVAAESRGGLIKFSKDKSAEKIDGMTAAAMALGIAMTAPAAPKGSVYEERGLVVIGGDD